MTYSDSELRRLAIEGRASGEPIDDETVLLSLHAKYAAMCDTHPNSVTEKPRS